LPTTARPWRGSSPSFGTARLPKSGQKAALV
jgi:hypothetical protein